MNDDVFKSRFLREFVAQLQQPPKPPRKAIMKPSTVVKLVIAGIALLATLVVGCSSLGTVPSGTVGVVTRFGATTGELKEPGLFVITPFVTGVESMDTQTHAYKASASAASRDLQDVTTEVTLNYRLNPDGAVRMFNEMRRDYGERLLVPAVQEAIKAVTARYDAEELITKRADVRTAIENMLRERLALHHIVLDQASITNFSFTPEFSKAIEAKVVATQQALKAQNDLVRIKTEAEQQVATAKGMAEAIKIQSEAIQQQGGAAYVQLKAVDKWDGTLPQFIGGTAPVPFINIKGVEK